MRAGKAACFAADEFFSARISNPPTRTAYAHQVSRFLAWCEDQGLELHQVTPGRAGASDGAAESPVLFIGSLLHSLGTTGEMVLGGIAVGRRPFHLRHPENARCLVQLAENKATGLNFWSGRSNRTSRPRSHFAYGFGRYPDREPPSLLF